MTLFAQAKEAAAEFHKAADTWGLATTVLLTLLIIVGLVLLFVCWKVTTWLKPKIDEGFVAHFALVKKLTDAIPEVKTEVGGIHAELKEQTDAIKDMAEKIDKQPSDFSKICQAEQIAKALKEAGYPPKVIERALKARGLPHKKAEE